MMKASKIAEIIEEWAPLFYQESYDNSGFQVGLPQNEVGAILLSLDVTEGVVDEAVKKGCQMIIAHHPLIFSGIKKITGGTYVEKVIMQALRNDIIIYAAHTNLDNLQDGVNKELATRLSLQNCKILKPIAGKLLKLVTYVPLQNLKQVQDALFSAGGGQIGQYTECSYYGKGVGTFKPGEHTNPTIGDAGGKREEVEEFRLEVIVDEYKKEQILAALFQAHPYEEVAYELFALGNTLQTVGAGIIGELDQPMDTTEFLSYLKSKLNLNSIKYTPYKNLISRVALCGGSGSFLLGDAIKQQADAFVTGDFKYHQYFDAEGKLMIADIGHYESEQFTSILLQHFLSKKLPNIALHLTDTITNPVKYFH